MSDEEDSHATTGRYHRRCYSMIHAQEGTRGLLVEAGKNVPRQMVMVWKGGGEKKNCTNSHKKERGEEAPMPRTVRGLPQTSSPASSAEKREGGGVVFIAERGKKALLAIDVGYNFLGTK